MTLTRYSSHYRKLVVMTSLVMVCLLTSRESLAERSGAKVFNSFCVACHLHGVAGAPKLGSAQDWQPRVEKGMPTLLKHVIEGLNAMPPRGMCSNCSDEELQSAVQFMIDNS